MNDITDGTHVDCEERRQARQVRALAAHLYNLRDDGLLRPGQAKYLNELPNVQCGGLANCVDVVRQPLLSVSTLSISRS